MQNYQEQANKILENGVFIYDYQKIKRQKQFTQYYTIDFQSPVKIGGLNETGYMLKHFKDSSPSNVCLTYIQALKLATGEKIVLDNLTISFKKIN